MSLSTLTGNSFSRVTQTGKRIQFILGLAGFLCCMQNFPKFPDSQEDWIPKIYQIIKNNCLFARQAHWKMFQV